MLVWLGFRAFVFSLILTPVIRDIFRAYDIVDRPDNTRKTHPYPVPRVGGMAIAIAYLLAAYLTPVSGPGGSSLVTRLLPSAMIVFIMGLIDDFVGLRPWQKLIGEFMAAAIAYWAGVRIVSVFGYSAQSWSSFLITIVWLLVCTNAFNLVDGLDGLAAGIGFFSTLTIFIAAIAQHSYALAAAAAPLAGCLLAFLCYNFNPATIFLGDCGSLLIGFLLGCYGVTWSQKSLTALGMMAPLIAFSLPLLDVMLAIVRRFLRRKPIFSADRGHIHHRLIDRGLSPRRVVLTIYGICGIAAATALVQSFTASHYVAILVTVAFISITWVGIRYLGYSEFILAGRFFRIRYFQRVLNSQLALEGFAVALLGAASVEDRWNAIRQHYANLGYSAVRLHLHGVVYREWAPEVSGPEYWTIRIPLSDTDFVELARKFRSDDTNPVVAPLAHLLHHGLSDRVREKPRLVAARSAAAS